MPFFCAYYNTAAESRKVPGFAFRRYLPELTEPVPRDKIIQIQKKLVSHMLRLILTDLDHTLLRHDGTISDYSLDVLRRCRAEGLRLAIATSRTWIGAERYIGQLNPDYAVTTDGTLVHAGRQCIYSSSFSVETSNSLIAELLCTYPAERILAVDEKTVYWDMRFTNMPDKLRKAVCYDFRTPVSFRANKIAADLPDEQMARCIAAHFPCRLQSYRGEKLYSFLPEHSGKPDAIRALCEHFGIALSDIAASGDDINDLEMMRMCGKGIAVANAVSEVLESADTITASNDDDGVARWLEINLL